MSYARQIPREDSRLTEKFIRAYNYPKESMVKSEEDLQRLGIKTYFCSNVCAAYKRDVYLQLGGFERHVPLNEDMLYAVKCMKKGWKICYAADAGVIHSHNIPMRSSSDGISTSPSRRLCMRRCFRTYPQRERASAL